MTTKQWLERGRNIDSNINSLLRSQRSVPTTVEYQYYEEIINTQIDKLVAIKAEIEAAITSVEDNILQTLLRDRYINCMTWEKIAENIHYESVRWVRTVLHENAIKELEKHRKEKS